MAELKQYFSTRNVAWGAGIATIASTWLALVTMAWSMYSLKRESDNVTLQEWQALVVYSIVDDTGINGAGFSDIKAKYIDEAATVKAVRLRSQSINDDSLKRVLIELIRAQLIVQDYDGRYATMRTVINPRTARCIQEEKAKYAIISLATTDAGRYTSADIAQKISGQVQLTAEEFSKVLAELVATEIVTIDDNGRLFSAIQRPNQIHTPSPGTKDSSPSPPDEAKSKKPAAAEC